MTVGQRLREVLESRDREKAEEAISRVKTILNSMRIDVDKGDLDDLPDYLDRLFEAVGIQP